jgi:uncharacterized protein (DUF2225 family)
MEKKVFWHKTYHCGLCGTKFSALKIFDQAVRLKSRDIYLRPVYEYPNPQYFALIVCPECYYTAFDKDFGTLPETLSIDTMNQLKLALKKGRETMELSLGETRNIKEVIDIYSLGILTYMTIRDTYKIAQLYLKLGWFYLEEANREKAAIALSKAASYFLEAYQYGNNMAEADGILFFLASIQLMLNNAMEGFRWLEKLIKEYKGTGSPYYIAAKALWEESRKKKEP